MTGAVQVPVKTAAHLIFFKKLQNRLTDVALIPGRIMQEDKLLPLTCGGQGGFQTDQLPLEHFFIMLSAFFLLKKPAPGSAYGPFLI